MITFSQFYSQWLLENDRDDYYKTIQQADKEALKRQNYDNHSVRINPIYMDRKEDPSHPDHPNHDVFKHGRPAVRHRHTGEIVIGKKSETHEEFRPGPYKEWEHGTWHLRKKEFYGENHPKRIDATEIMNKKGRRRHGIF